MSTTSELVERLKDVAEWKQIVERHRRITDDPAISYVLQDGTRIHEDENVIAKLAASFFRALEGAADTASAAAERLAELERENARLREALKREELMANRLDAALRRAEVEIPEDSEYRAAILKIILEEFPSHMKARAALAGSGEK